MTGPTHPPLEISVARYSRTCGYHRRGNERYSLENTVPPGFCPAMYHAVYPYLLALLYDATFPFAEGRDLRVSCPGSGCPAVVTVGFEFKRLRRVLNLVEAVGRALGFPKDAIDKVMRLTVVRAGGPCGLKEGGEHRVRIPEARELCPASFFSLYPLSLVASRTPFRFWHPPGGGISFSCPDPGTDIVYDLGRLPAGGPNPSLPGYVPDLSRYTLRLRRGDACDLGSFEGERTPLDRVVPAGLCPYVFNIAIPYALTFLNGGHFKWRKSTRDVEAQCPNPLGGVSFLIERGGAADEVSLKIVKVRGRCSCGHAAGEAFPLSPLGNTCLHLFARVFTRVLLMEFGGEDPGGEVAIRCPFPGKETEYRLEKAEER